MYQNYPLALIRTRGENKTDQCYSNMKDLFAADMDLKKTAQFCVCVEIPVYHWLYQNTLIPHLSHAI